MFSGSDWHVKRPTIESSVLIALIEAIKREITKVADLIDPKRDSPERECGHRLCRELDNAFKGMDHVIESIHFHTERDGNIAVGEYPVEAMERLNAWLDRRYGA